MTAWPISPEQLRTDLANGRAGTVECEIRALLAANGEDPELRLMLGRSLAVLNRLPEAAQEFEGILARDPNHLPALIELGATHVAAGETQRAIDAPLAAVAGDSAAARPHWLLGAARLQAGDLASARGSFLEALSRDPDSAQAHNGLGEVCERLGDEQQAIESYARAAAASPGWVDPVKNLCRVRLRCKDFVGALEPLRALVRLDPGDALGHGDLGKALLATAQFPEAVTALERARQLDATSSDAATNLGEALLNLGKLDAAASAFCDALSIEPQKVEASMGLGRLLATSGYTAQAAQCWINTCRSRPNDVGHALVVASCSRLGADPGAASAARGNGCGSAVGEVTCRSRRTVVPQRADRGGDQRIRSFDRNRTRLYSRPPRPLLGPREGRSLRASHRQPSALLAISPGNPRSAIRADLYNQHGAATCDWDALELAVTSLRELPHGLDGIHPCALLAIQDDPNVLLDCSRQYCARHAPQEVVPVSTRPVRPRDRIRIAYLSADFRPHATMQLPGGVFQLNTRAHRFETFGVSLRQARPLGDRTAPRPRVRTLHRRQFA